MEEGCGVAHRIESGRQGGYRIARIDREDEGHVGLDDRREYRRHSIDRLHAIGVGVGEDIGALHQRVDEGREASVAGDVLVQSPDPFTGEALPDDEDDVAPLVLTRDGRGAGSVDRVEVRRDFCEGHVLVLGQTRLADRAYQTEGSIEHQSSLLRATDVDIRIAQRDGACLTGEAPTGADDGEVDAPHQQDEGCEGERPQPLRRASPWARELPLNDAEGDDEGDPQERYPPIIDEEAEEVERILLAKLLEDSHRRTLEREAVVDDIP